MDPQSLPAIADQRGLSKLCKVTRNVGLGGSDRMGEFTDAEFLMLQQQQQAAKPGGMG